VPNLSQPTSRDGRPTPQKIPLDFLLPCGEHANLHIMGGLDPAVNLNMPDCQGQSKTRPQWPSKSRPVAVCEVVGFAGQKGLWSVAEEALLPCGAWPRG
jgi:hypothetical protein